MGVNAINLSFHRAVRVDEWVLYHHESTFAGAGMTHAGVRVHAEGGELLASFNVEAMVRPFPGGGGVGRADGTMSLMYRTRASERTTGRTLHDADAVGHRLSSAALAALRAVKGGRTLIDSERVLLVHRPGRPPSYAFPEGDVRGVPVEPEPDSPGYVTVEWEAVDSWFEEAEEVFGHPKNPYHRVDCLRSERRLVVEVGGATLVDTSETLVVL